MYTLLIIIAILSILLVWLVFRLWKKNNVINKLYDFDLEKSDLGSGDERNEGLGIETDWPSSIETPDGVVDAVTITFSQGGAFIRCRDPLPIGEIFRLKIYVPDKDPIDTKAKVVWSNVNVPQDRVVNRGMGVQFIK